MLIVPGLPPLQETSRSRELGRKVEQLVRDYQRDHPDMTEGEVRAALVQAGGDSPEMIRRKRVLAVVIGFLTVGAFTVMARTGGAGFENNTTVWRAIGVVVAVVAVMFAVIRTARRS